MFLAPFSTTLAADEPAGKQQGDEAVQPSDVTDKSTDEVTDEESARAKISWQEIGQVDNMMIAGLAKEMLESEGIPVVVMSQAGFLGELGVPLASMFSGEPVRTRLLVPREAAEEATSLMFETMGEMWYPVSDTGHTHSDKEH